MQLHFTIDDIARGEAIVANLLDARLIACAQTIGPITSRYRWHGSIEQAQEWLFVCKTTHDLAPPAIEVIRARHPYETPEIVEIAITGGLGPYLDWIAAETATARGTDSRRSPDA